MPKTKLGVEQKFFADNKLRFLKKYKNKYLLIKGRRVYGAYDSISEAYSSGLTQFGNVPMFIKQVAKEEPISHLMAFA